MTFSPGAAGDLGDPGVQGQMDAVCREQVLDRGRDVGILARGELRPVLDDGHLGPEMPEGLGHLHADVAAADHQQVLGQHVELQRLDMRERRGLPQARDRRDGGARAEVQVDALPGEPARAALGRDLDDPGFDEPPPAEHELEPARGERLGVDLDHAGHDLRGARGHAAHVDGRCLGQHDPELACAPGQVRDLGAADQRLGRDAGDVDAGAADHAGLDDGDALAGLGLVHRQRLAGLAAAQDQDVVVFDRDHDGLLQ